MTAIIDYRAGNLTSVRYAFASLGVEAVVTNDPSVLVRADRFVFPGVGAAKSAMANLCDLGLVDVVRSAAGSGKPFLGICMGMQILFDHSEEDGGTDLLGILSGRVRRFPDSHGFKVPEIGWNQVRFADGSSPEYYFVHSYYVEKGPYTSGTSEYAGVEFTAQVRKDNILACQFHPEKSGRVGLELLKEWMSAC